MHPSSVITQFEVSELLCQAYTRAANISNVMGSFRGGGIWPINRYVFKDSEFVASDALTVPDAIEDKDDVGNAEAKDNEVKDAYQPLTGEENNDPQLSDEDDDIPQINFTRIGRNYEINKIAEKSNDADDLTQQALYFSPERIKPNAQNNNSTNDGYGDNTRTQRKLLAYFTKNSQFAGCIPRNNKQIEKQFRELGHVRQIKKENEANEKKTKKIDCRVSEPSTSKANIEINLDEWYCFICDEKIAEEMIQCCQWNMGSFVLLYG
ncbi:unnamed protein product [Callosobruchus maculatus]|uniref:Uncharacterized protein n=1 Tax=Callosobruchus maculatus TaxID=64391 RepID=A0A653BGW7_CALMS|nr:unnamed protein product [Callosobruchus maculatus]